MKVVALEADRSSRLTLPVLPHMTGEVPAKRGGGMREDNTGELEETPKTL